MIWTDNGYGTRRGFQVDQTPPISLASAPFGIEMATPTPLSKLLPPDILCYSFSEERKIERFSEHLLRKCYVSLQILGLYTTGIDLSCSILMTKRTGSPAISEKMNSLRLGIIRHQNLLVSDRRAMSSSSETQMASRQQRLPLKIGILSI